MNKKITAFIIVLVSLYFIGSVTRSISTTQDNKLTLIRNSKGNYWEANTTNIQLAIDELGSEGGTVWLPGTITFYPTKTIIVKEGVMLDMGGASFKLPENTDITIVELQNNAGIRDGTMDVAGFISQFHSYSQFEAPHSCIFLNASSNIETATIENMNLDSIGLGYRNGEGYYNGIREGRGYGIHLYAGDHDIPQKITGVTGRHLYMRNFKHGIFIQNERGASSSEEAHVDGNTFEYMWLHANEVSINISRKDTVDRNKASTSGNVFNMVQIQTGGGSWWGGDSISWHHIIADGSSNVFKDFMCWDPANLNGSPKVAVHLTSDSENAFVSGRCQLNAYLVNEGTNNTLVDTGIGRLTISATTQQG